MLDLPCPDCEGATQVMPRRSGQREVCIDGFKHRQLFQHVYCVPCAKEIESILKTSKL